MTAIAIVGYGYWGPKLTRNFVQSGRFGRVWVCEEDQARRTRAQAENPSIATVASFDEIIGDPSVTAVAIATPVGSHFALARAALNAGKHVLVEKPLAHKSIEAEELVKLAAIKNRVLMVDHTFIYHPAVQKIRDLVHADELGRLNYIDSTRINLGLFQHDVNVLWDLAVHDIAIVNFLTKERPVSVQAIGAKHSASPFENIGILTLRYGSGLFVHINCSWVSPVKIRHILIGGDKKMVVYDDLNATEPVKVYDSGIRAHSDEEKNRLLFEYRIGDVYSPKIQQKEALSNLVTDFARAIFEGGTPVSDGRFGADAVRILEGAQHSLGRSGGEVLLSWN